MSGDPVDPGALEIGAIYRDDDGTRWAVVGRDDRGATLVTSPPSEAPDWHGVLIEVDGAWYESDRFVGHVRGLIATGEQAACRGCGGRLVASPGTSPANHHAACPWLAGAVRAVARGVASPSGRWLRPPAPGEVAAPHEQPAPGEPRTPT